VNRSYLLSKEKGNPIILTLLKEAPPQLAFERVFCSDDGTKAVIVSAANRKHAKLIGKRLMKRK
jgi:hypothetical protein